jgi:hypothetical protein
MPCETAVTLEQYYTHLGYHPPGNDTLLWISPPQVLVEPASLPTSPAELHQMLLAGWHFAAAPDSEYVADETPVEDAVEDDDE